MNDLLLHELGARRVHWRYDDPSGLPATTRADHGALPVRSAGEIRGRVLRAIRPKAA